MADMDWDELVICPTCGQVARPDEDDEHAHEQPCPECGYTQVLFGQEVHDDGRVDVHVRWDQGEGARLLLPDVEKAIGIANDFLFAEEAEEDRIDQAMLEMRQERQREARS